MQAGTSDFYEVLGVERQASADEIKRAFRRKAREFHPDVNSASDAEERFKEVNAAYDVLSDPAKRAQYDRFGSVGRGPGAGAAGGYDYVDLNDLFGSAGGFGMGDIFSAFFGGVAGAAQGSRHEGRDMAMSVSITLEEAATGIQKEIVVDRLAPCDVCGGSGAHPGTTVIRCPDCGGTGQRVAVRQTFLGTMQTSMPCQRCGATGSTVENPCEECQGSGRVPDRQHLTIDIPAGMGDGQQVRLRGMGEAGIRSASPGDLMVVVRVLPHEFLHREGDDLHCKANISIAQAALGATLKVCGLLEENEVGVPAGTQHGDSVRLKGRGMPKVHGTNRGDLIIHIGVQVPKKLSKRQRELLKELSIELGDDSTVTSRPLDRLKDWLRG